MTAFQEWFSNFSNLFYKCFIRDDRYKLLLDGIGVTVKVSLLAILIGVVIGMLVALCNLSRRKVIRFLGIVFIDLIRGTPSVTQLMIIYFVIFATVDLDKWIIAAIAFGVNSGAYVSEIIRAGILSVDHGQTEAGRSLGLNAFQTMTRIVIPQETAIVGYVGLMDIQKAGDFIKSATFNAFMPLFGTAVIYYVLIKILTLLLRRIEIVLRRSDIR